MRITMENCGNIEIGDLQIKPGLINIKYGRSRYEKMLLYLAMFRDKEQNPKVVRYLIGEFLQEEERMLRVDPVKFNVIPPDIMKLCDSAVRKSQKNT